MAGIEEVREPLNLQATLDWLEGSAEAQRVKGRLAFAEVLDASVLDFLEEFPELQVHEQPSQ